MKSTIFKTTIIAFMVIGFTACTTSTKDNSTKTGIEYTSKYICPMHCEGSGSAEAGQCPVCGMDYKLNEEHAN